MARRKKRKYNPTTLETVLIAGGTAIVGGLGGFWLASWACGKVIRTASEAGVIQPGPNAGPMASALQ